jgi:hypothetical protein
MASQLDLDQGGTFRTYLRQYLGPSIGWVQLPLQSILPISAAGTYTLLPGVTFVPVNVAGLVTINLPSSRLPSVSGGVLPGLFSNSPITIADVGGNAAAFNITINPAAADSVMGLSTIAIITNYGEFTLSPNSGIWNA